jgi:hypothetical protein
LADTNTVAIIGAAATVSAALIGAYHDEVKGLLKSIFFKKNEYLLGAWDCTWDTQTPAGRPQIIDSVRIESVRGQLVKGTGTTPGFGEWKLQGRVTQFAASFSYSGVESKFDLPGALVLRIANPNQMTGAWAQYSGTGDVISGTTGWKRH